MKSTIKIEANEEVKKDFQECYLETEPEEDDFIRVTKLLNFAEKYEVQVYFSAKKSSYNPRRICVFNRHHQNPPYLIFVHLPDENIHVEVRGYY